MSHYAEPLWAVVPARMSSERLPGKSMTELAGKPSLVHIVDRLRAVPSIEGIVVATSENPVDDVIAECADGAGVACFRGDEADVLGRTAGAVASVGASHVVNVGGDCPLVDPLITQYVIAEYFRARPDYARTAVGSAGPPLGMDVEVFRGDRLAEIETSYRDARIREHVTVPFYEDSGFHSVVVPIPSRYVASDLRVTLDTAEDLDVIRAVYDELQRGDRIFAADEVISFLRGNPGVARTNQHVQQRSP